VVCELIYVRVLFLAAVFVVRVRRSWFCFCFFRVVGLLVRTLYSSRNNQIRKANFTTTNQLPTTNQHQPNPFKMNQQYYSINPGTFDNIEVWKFRDLQTLCKSLKIKANGTRDELIERLTYWHRCSRNAGNGSCGNFACVGVNIFSPTQPEKCNVSPRLLTPLRKKSRASGETPRSILKSGRKSARKSVSKLTFSPYNEVRVIPDRHSAEYR